MSNCRATLRLCLAICIAWVASSAALSAPEGKSGPPSTQPALKVGADLPAAFEPLNVTGEFAGRRHCLVCENGLNPVVMIFARRPSPAIATLLSKTDAAIAADKTGQLGAFAVFLSSDDKLEEELAGLGKRLDLKSLVLSIDTPAGPEGYPTPAEVDVQVVLYTKHTVKAIHTFGKGEFAEPAVEKILADLPKILPAAK